MDMQQQGKPMAQGVAQQEAERLLRALTPRLAELIRQKRKWKMEINAAPNAPFALVVTEYDSL